jgi:hypothetical protein
MEAAMCTLPNKTSSTDYVRLKVPDDPVGSLRTAPGKPAQRKALAA